MELLERELQLDLLKREARSLSESYGAVLSQSKSLLKAMEYYSHLNYLYFIHQLKQLKVLIY